MQIRLNFFVSKKSEPRELNRFLAKRSSKTGQSQRPCSARAKGRLAACATMRHRVVAVGAYTLQSAFTPRPESPEGKDVALRRRVEEMLFGLGGTKEAKREACPPN